MITLLLKFWKEGIIIALTVACFTLYQYNIVKKQETDILNMQVSKITADLSDRDAKLEVVNKALLNSDKNRIESENKRQEIIKVMTAEINKLRLQTPPKECSAAVEWAIGNKSDLSWPK